MLKTSVCTPLNTVPDVPSWIRITQVAMCFGGFALNISIQVVNTRKNTFWLSEAKMHQETSLKLDLLQVCDIWLFY